MSTLPHHPLGLEALKLLVTQTPVAMAILDRDMRYLAVSDRWVRDYRLNPDQILGRTHYEVFPNLPAEWEEQHRRILKGESDTCEKHLFTHRDGCKDWIKWNVAPWRGPDQKVEGVIFVTEIINQIVYAQEALAAGEEKYRKIFDHSADGIILHDRNGLIIDANPKVLNMLGYSLLELKGKLLASLHPKNALHDSKQAFGKIMEEKSVQFEIKFLRKDGSGFLAEVSSSLYELEAEALIQGIIRDVTDRKEMEEAKRSSMERELAQVDRKYNQLVESLPAAILVIEPDGRISFVNQAAANMVQLPKEEIVGERITSPRWSITDTTGQDLDEETRPFTRIIREKTPILGHEFMMRRNDGTTFVLSSNLAPLFDQRGNFEAILVTGVEVTEHRMTQDALRASEERLRQVTDSIREVFWMTDPFKHAMLYISPAYEDVWGRSCASAYDNPKSFLDAIHDDDRDRVIQNLERQVLGTYDELYRVVRPDGSTRWIRDKAFPIRNEAGEVYRVAGIAEDVTALKIASEKLEETNIFLDSIVENIPHMIFVKDAKDLRFIRWNVAGEKIVGHGREDLLGKNDYDFFTKEEADFFTQNDRQVLESGAPKDIPKEPIHTSHQGTRFLHTKKIPILDKQNIPRFLLGISEDITEKLKIERDGRLLANITERSVDAIMTLDREGHFTFWNQAAEQIFGYPASDVLEKSILDFFIPPKHQDEVSQFLQTDPKSPAAVRRLRSERLHQDGRIIPVMITSFPLLGEDDEFLAWVALTQDLTEIVNLERKMADQTRMAALGQMVAGIAHEIRNPLFGISSTTQILGTHCQDDKELKELSLASLGEISRLKKLVDEMLLYARPSAVAKSVFQPDELFEAILQMHASLLEEKRVSVEASFEPQGSTFQADAEKIRQVILNLLLNAIHASPKGGLVRIQSQVDSQTGWEFQIHNLGGVIPKSSLHRVFEPFVSTKKDGSGLGLAVCQKVIEEHDGTLWCTSHAEKGTTFTFRLPPDATLTTIQKSVKDKVTK